jgi:hypothetical protein
MIADTLTKSQLGSDIVKETSGALNKIVDGVDDSAAILTEIAAAATAQNDAIDEVNRGISQLTNVVFQNSATAEESAAASEEMRSQTSVLIGLVDRFIVDEADRAKQSEPAPVFVPAAFAEPEPEPEPAPVFEPVPVAEPEPVPAPVFEPVPVLEQEPAPVFEPAPVLEPEPAPAPVFEPAPVAEPEPEPAVEPAPTPAPDVIFSAPYVPSDGYSKY